MIRILERGPWVDVRPDVQERDLRRYRLRRSLFGGLVLQVQIERREIISGVTEFGFPLWKNRRLWRAARPRDFGPAAQIIVEVGGRSRRAGE
jgi:hypothetical protein